MLLYRKDISLTNGDEATSTADFRLIKYRSEHNHVLDLYSIPPPPLIPPINSLE